MKKSKPVQNPPAPRRRNAVATREAILNSARLAFARLGYDGAGTREIAKGAGVTAMMVNRYFGSKEQLFAEVAVKTMSNPTILTSQNLGSSSVGKAMASALIHITRTTDTPLEGFLIMLRSVASKPAAEIGRAQIEQHYQKTLTAALRGDLAPQRAALVFALVSGVQVMRQMLGLSALADADPDALIRLLAPLFQLLIDGDQGMRCDSVPR